MKICAIRGAHEFPSATNVIALHDAAARLATLKMVYVVMKYSFLSGRILTTAARRIPEYISGSRFMSRGALPLHRCTRTARNPQFIVN